MKKLITGVLVCIFSVFFIAGCSTQTSQFQEENVALREQVAELEHRLEQSQRYLEQHEERFGVLTNPSCGLTMLEIVEDAYGNLELVVHICRITNTTGIVAEERLAESDTYQILLGNAITGDPQGVNPLFAQLYSFGEGNYALPSVPERLEAANISFSWGGTSREFGLIISSYFPIRIDESRVDTTNLPRNEGDNLIFANSGEFWQHLRFAIPILVG